MLASRPLHEPAVVHQALAEIGVGPGYPGKGLAVVHDGFGPDHPSDHPNVHDNAEAPPECVLIPDVPADPPQHDRIRALGPLFRALTTARGATSVALVVLRRGEAVPRGHDYAWHDACDEAARAAGMSQAGVYVLARGVLARVSSGWPVTA